MKYKETRTYDVIAYTHRLGVQDVKSLEQFIEYYGEVQRPVKKGELRKRFQWTPYQDTNFAHLAYWGLIEKCVEEGEQDKWKPTDKGRAFLSGSLNVKNVVAVMAREVLPDDHIAWTTHEGNVSLVSVGDIKNKIIKTKPDFVEEKTGAVHARLL